MNPLDPQNSHIVVDGQFVSAKVERIVQAIHDYEPELEVKWIPPNARTEGESAFAIIHNAPGNAPYVLMYVKTEEEFDERVLQRIIYNDQRNTGQQEWSELSAWEEAQKRIQKQAYLDLLEEANDVAFHVLRSPLNTYKVSDDFVIKDGIPWNTAAKTERRN